MRIKYFEGLLKVYVLVKVGDVTILRVSKGKKEGTIGSSF